MIYFVTVQKTIDVRVEAESEQEAEELAREYESNGWDGLWLHARPDVSVYSPEGGE